MKAATLQRPTGTATRRDASHGGIRSQAEAFLGSIKSAGAKSGGPVRQFCATYAVTQDTFTRLTGFSPRAVANWNQGQKPGAPAERRLVELKRLFTALEQLVAQEAIGPWLKEPNGAFDGSTPLQVIERGELDRLWRMIYELESGEPG
jgi:DNA-binding transcriptional regulator YiaG